MNLSVPRITRMCESWWEQIAAGGRRGRYAEELLGLLGWETPLPFTPREASLSLGAQPYVLRARGKNALAVYLVQPGTIEAPSAVTERFLDFCPATRMLAEEAHGLGVHRTLITDLYRSYLYDTETGELLRAADDPRKFNDDVVPVIEREAVERGALDELRGASRTAAGRQLRGWCDRWTRLLARHARLTEERASLVADRLLVVRFLFERAILRRTRWQLEQRFEEIVSRAGSPRAHGVGQALVGLFHDMWFDWGIDLFEVVPELDDALADDEVAVPMLREFSLLSDRKFLFETVLESFNFGDPSEKLRVRMVPDMNEERDLYLAKQTVSSVDAARLEVDITEEGYRAVTHWFDRVTAMYERVENDFRKMFYAAEKSHVADYAEAARSAPDLFGWAVIDGERPRACAEKFAHACAQGFGAFYNGFRQYRTARLVLTLHLIQRYHETGLAVNRLPSLRPALMPRPELLTAARLMRVREALPLRAEARPAERESEESAA